MSTTKTSFKGIASRVFRALMPVTAKIDKSDLYYKYGWNDNLPTEIIDAINNSGVAKKAAKKQAEFIYGNSFQSEASRAFKVNDKQTAEKILLGASLSMAYIGSAVFHISRLGDGTIASVKLMPFQKVRKGTEGDWLVNETIGSEKFDKSKWERYQNFVGTVATTEDLAVNIRDFDKRGEILYVYNGNEFDSAHYSIPDYYAAIEDVKTSSEISKMDYEAVLNGFMLGGTLTFIGADGETKDEFGMTEQDAIAGECTNFTGLKKNEDGLTSRFAVMLNFVKTADQVPVYTSVDPKPILEASNAKRDIIERAVCRLFGVHPVLIGYSEASILGNDKALAQAVEALSQSVKINQDLLEEAFTKMFPQMDWKISRITSSYIETSLLPDMTKDERRALVNLEPIVEEVPSAGKRILDTLNNLSPLLATKVIDLIDKEVLLDALGIENKENTTPQL